MIDLALVNSRLVQGMDKVCSSLLQSYVAQSIGVAQNTAQHKLSTHRKPRVAELGLSISLLQQGKRSKNEIFAHDIVQMGVLLKVATCCIRVAVFPKVELCSSFLC